MFASRLLLGATFLSNLSLDTNVSANVCISHIYEDWAVLPGGAKHRLFRNTAESSQRESERSIGPTPKPEKQRNGPNTGCAAA
jgi:hypothetical protein